MINRRLGKKLQEIATKFPVVSLNGPRQSGKSTLLKSTFQHHNYISLEDPDVLRSSQEDPRGFLERLGVNVIIDETQRNPELFSYVQGIVDKENIPGMYILSGSSNFLLMQSITQTLAGRVGILTVLPFSQAEVSHEDTYNWIWTGGYPRIYDQNIDPNDYYPNYINTYVQRDVHLIKNITNQNTFRNFLSVCASRVGQQIDITDLSKVVGVTVPTINSWLSLLETSYIAFRLQPYYNNFDKRITKSPKLYFFDTGLVCSLLSINSADILKTHELKGNIFENAILVDLLKNRYNDGLHPNVYFWRQSETSEVDIIFEENGGLEVFEVKSSRTYNSKYTKSMQNFLKSAKQRVNNAYVVYDGDLKVAVGGVKFINRLDVANI